MLRPHRREREELSQVLEKKAQSAQSKGISNSTSVKQSTAGCPLRAKNDGEKGANKQKKPPTHYEDCVLKSLTVKLTSDDKSHTFAMNRQRRAEPVHHAVHDDYKGDLTSHELVIEALANSSDHNVDETLLVEAWSSCSPVHTTFTPLHPETEIGNLARAVQAHVAKAKIYVPERSAYQSWASIWPFSAARTQKIPITGEACGHIYKGCNVPPTPALKELSAQLVALPNEEWTFKIKDLKSGWSKSKSRTSEFNMAENVADKDARFRSTKTVIKNESGLNASSTETKYSGGDHQSYSKVKVNEDKSGDEYSYTKSSSSASESVSYTKAGGLQTDKHTESVNAKSYTETREKTYKANVPIGAVAYSLTNETGLDAATNTISSKSSGAFSGSLSDRISLEVKCAGQVSKFEPSAWLDGLLKLSDIFEAIRDLLKSCRVGAGFSYDYKMLYGDCEFSWGYRWPQAPRSYAEEHRVHYVERFLSAKGPITVLSGSLGGWIGIDFEKGWLPAGTKLMLEGTITASLSVTPSLSLAYTNIKTAQPKDLAYEIEPSFKIEAKIEGTGSARFLNYRRTAYCQLASTFEAKAKMKLSFSNPPSLKASVDCNGIKITGHFYNSSRVPPEAHWDPIILMDKKEIMKEREVWT